MGQEEVRSERLYSYGPYRREGETHTTKKVKSPLQDNPVSIRGGFFFHGAQNRVYGIDSGKCETIIFRIFPKPKRDSVDGSVLVRIARAMTPDHMLALWDLDDDVSCTSLVEWIIKELDFVFSIKGLHMVVIEHDFLSIWYINEFRRTTITSIVSTEEYNRPDRATYDPHFPKGYKIDDPKFKNILRIKLLSGR